jgi:phosphohistidine phosphatase
MFHETAKKPPLAAARPRVPPQAARKTAASVQEGARTEADYPGAMRLVIVRHAEAAPGSPDELRALTPEGLARARDLGERLRREVGEPDALLASPLPRAMQTAAALGLGEPEADERLGPGAGVDDVRAAVRGRGETVIVVGHQPDCGRIAAALAGGPEPAFPPAGSAIVELADDENVEA